MQDGRYEGANGNYIVIKGADIIIGTPFTEIATVTMPPNIRLSQAKEIRNGDKLPA